MVSSVPGSGSYANQTVSAALNYRLSSAQGEAAVEQSPDTSGL